jgi:hypothetical protein
MDGSLARWIAVAALFGILASTPGTDAAATAEVATASTPDEFELSRDELALLSTKGINGDGEAAYRVFLHYSMGWESGKSSEEQERWLAYAVENGYETAWLTRAQNLIGTRSTESCRRASYWFHKLLNSNDVELANAARQEISATKKYWAKLFSGPMCDEFARL